MKKTREELIKSVRAYIGDRTDDESVALLEDVSDSFEESSENTVDWESKYNELDAEWRKRYIDRFSGKKEKDVSEDEDKEKRTFKDLFEES